MDAVRRTVLVLRASVRRLAKRSRMMSMLLIVLPSAKNDLFRGRAESRSEGIAVG